MCGPTDKASRRAEQAETERQQQVTAATSAIERAFGGRSGQIEDFASALRGEFRTEAERQKAIADRQLKFALARGGLTKGSADVDARVQLGDEFQRGNLKAENSVQAAIANLMSADESSKQNLISLAQGGAGITSSFQNAANALRANLQGARSASTAEGLGDIFTNTRGLYTRQQEAAARRRGLSESLGNVYADPFSKS